MKTEPLGVKKPNKAGTFRLPAQPGVGDGVSWGKAKDIRVWRSSFFQARTVQGKSLK